MKKPIAVLTSDVHYSLPNLKLADAAMRMAIAKANELDVPLIVAGDLHDTKANLRGECVNAILETLKPNRRSPIIILRGNHDAINEKSTEHSLNFLEYDYDTIEVRHVVTKPENMADIMGVWSPHYIYLIPYYHDANELRAYLKTVPKGSTLIMHQGLQSSNAGEYFQDKSAINPEDVAGFRVISGHYHARQTIKLPNGGVWDYIGNPFTTSYGEANDPPKGFQILMEDGSLEFVPTNLRKHVVINWDADVTKHVPNWDRHAEDLIWVKVTANRGRLLTVTKELASNCLGLAGLTFKLDLIPTESETTTPVKAKEKGELLDSLIDSLTNTTQDSKDRLKTLWRDLETK